MAYQELFDHRPGQHAEGHAPVFTLSEEASGKATLRNGADAGVAGTLVAWPTETVPSGAFGLDFAEAHLFEGAAALTFVPASLNSLLAMYAQAVADSLPIVSPPVRLVQLERDGRKMGPYLVEERMTPVYVLQHGEPAMAWVEPDGQIRNEDGQSTEQPDSLSAAQEMPLFRADRFNADATAALWLLAAIEQRTGLLEGGAGVFYDRLTGEVLPVHGMMMLGSREPKVPYAAAFREAMGSAATQKRIIRLAQKFRADSAAWTSRLLALDSALVPVLAKGRNLGLVQAEVDRGRERFLQRMFHPDLAAFKGVPDTQLAKSDIPLDPWLTQFHVQRDTIRFVRGKYDIDHDLVLPQGMAVVLEKGTRWFMAPGVSVVVNGELHMRGTDLNPVFIRPQEGSGPYGSIAVNGAGGTRVRITGLRISDGSGMQREGLRHQGMLSFIGCQVRMDHCAIGESFGRAAVSAKRGPFQMMDCSLTGAHGSFLDLAEVTGAVDRCSFTQPVATGLATGRAAVDMRASHILLRGCSFIGLPYAAARAGHAGELLVMGTKFSGNTTAINAIDGSKVSVEGCDFTDNGKVFLLRGIRPVLGGAILKSYANTFAGNGAEQDVDAASKVEVGTALDPQRVKELAGARP